MNASEKKIKKKEDIGELILKSAKEILIEEGYQSTSIRKIAAKIGYSPTTIYLYYKDKNDIIYALHQEGFGLLRTMFTALMNIEHPLERLKALAKTYLQFAKENPDFYELMFMMKEPMDFLNDDDSEIWEGGSRVFDLIVSTIKECQAQGYFFDTDPNRIALQAWGVVHGLCSLYITTRMQKIGKINFGEGNADILLEEAFQTYVSFIEQNKKEII